MSFSIVHYINQFFAGIGGEEKANFEPEERIGAVGPGAFLQECLGEEARIIATLICGDNYFTEHKDEASYSVHATLKKHKPDLVIAGPSFYAGRYGFACGEVAKIAHETLKIITIGGMSEENPAITMFSPEMYIVRTGSSAKYMREAVLNISDLALKILKKIPLRSAFEEGYYPRGIRRNFFHGKSGAARAVEMLLKKMNEEPFESEYLQSLPEKVEISFLSRKLNEAKIAICTTGGLVPAGNPDRIEGSAATKYGAYSFVGQEALRKGEFISVHGGYDTSFALENPNRIVPVDVLREMEKRGTIGKLHEIFYSTTGTGASFKSGETFGRGIAKQLSEGNVDGVIMVST